MNKWIVSETQVYKTNDHGIFTRLEGNRPIKEQRVSKIINSIARHGYISNPIIVNEKLEIIDGQGREMALDRLGMPVEFIIVEGLTIVECRAMNIHQSNWTTRDHIDSFACTGNEDYSRVQSLLKSFSNLPDNVIYAAAYDMYRVPSHVKIKSGSMECSKDAQERAKWRLGYASELQKTAKKLGGSSQTFFFAILYAYDTLEIEQHQRLKELLIKCAGDISRVSKVDLFLREFDNLYNKGQKKDKITLEAQWIFDHITGS